MKKTDVVLWGFKPGTANTPIKLAQFTKGEQARRNNEGWTTAVYAKGDSPDGLIEFAKQITRKA